MKKNIKSFTFFDYLLNGLYFLLYWPFKYFPSPVGDYLRYLTTIFFIKSGSYVRLYEGVTIWYPYRVTIGKKVTINEWVYISGFGGVSIGNGCSIGHRVSIISSNHGLSKTKSIKSQPLSADEVKIGNDVWIGNNAVILTGLKISDGCIIGANSVINTDLPPYSIVQGVPGKIIRFRFKKNIIAKLLKLKWWEKSDEEINKINFKKYVDN